jgi:hypothetical protein
MQKKQYLEQLNALLMILAATQNEKRRFYIAERRFDSG